MFIAPLNWDIFFKKVFSDKQIAKEFLEAFLSVKITGIKVLFIESKITDNAVTVKFDYRCKINGKYVIIEMQQKYKLDVVKRFYLYHALSTVLQLETLKPVIITKPNGETYTEKNYSGIEPVLTLIWMVDDTLGFKDDFVVFTTLPEAAKDFIKDDALWKQPIEKITEERNNIVKILDNKTKGLDFFSQNKLIYIFQKNIITNGNVNLPYFKYFDFANISKNPNNKEEDFAKFNNVKEMSEIARRLKKDNWTAEEYKYVSDMDSYHLFWSNQYDENNKKWERKYAKREKQLENELFLERQKAEQERQKAAIERQTAEQEKLEALKQERLKAEQERLKAEQEKVKAKLLQKKLIKMYLQQGDTILLIAEALDLTLEETTELVDEIQNKEQ
jgi:hypothetical protein